MSAGPVEAQPAGHRTGETQPLEAVPRPELGGIGFGAGVLWESRYVTEGRDNLKEGGIFSLETAVDLCGFALGAWAAVGDSEEYQEFNFFAEYHHRLGEFEMYAGYTRLEFYPDHESDNELSAGVSYQGIPYLIPATDYVHSTEAGGSFVEVSLRSELAFLEERLTVSPYILEGFDLGYATEEFDGPNNLQVGVEVSYSLLKWCDLIGYVAHSWAHEDVEREGLGDLSWGGVGVSASF